MMTDCETELHVDYAAAGFGRALRPGTRPVLLLIDFARAYFDAESPLYARVETVRASAARLYAAARLAQVPVIFTRVTYEPGVAGRDGGMFYRKISALSCFDQGNPLSEFTSELAPAAGDRVVVKQFPSAFFGTGLADDLHRGGIDTVVVAGLSTSGCVRASAVDALCYGFVPLVVRDAVGDRDVRVHDANLFDLAAKAAEIIGEAEACAYFAALR